MTTPDSAGCGQKLLDFIQQSPTPFHAVANLRARLLAAGFRPLDEAAPWQLAEGGRYFVTRNGSSLVAFTRGENNPVDAGFRLVGAHTDSPALRVKPKPDLYRQSCWQWGVEVYGGALLATWFDRELGVAGKVSVEDGSGQLHHLLFDSGRAVGVVPSLAIHLDREANNNRSINAQRDLPLLVGLAANDEKPDFASWLLEELRVQHPAIAIARLLDHELFCYDRLPGGFYGVQGELMASARLDNLLSCHAAVEGLLAADGRQNCILACFDHEEVGSSSHAGAQGSLLRDILARLLPDAEGRIRAAARSMLLSVDNAHAVHPNFADKHDENHGPKLNAGPVIKIHSGQRYASNSETQARFRSLCDSAGIPVQTFVVRSDMACGSTIGPIVAAETGIRTLDIGVPTLGMHSIRETAGVLDLTYLQESIQRFYSLERV